jgi:predicted Fe-Mo cluster-binding NifX family protein
MTKKIAIPMAGGKLSLHFGHCEQFAVIEIENGEVVKESLVNPPEHVPGSYPNFLAQKGVHEVLVGGIGQKAIEIFNANNIKVHMGAQAKTMAELVDDYNNDRLITGMNNCDGGCE